MGFLHEGHLSLMREARERAGQVVTSIFVNPTQFARREDLAIYPRDAEGDLAKCEDVGVDAVYLPEAEAVYADGHATRVTVDRLTEPLCGRFRPGHFEGVTTIVAKLINVVEPDLAFFGEKDFQQLAVLRRMVADLDMGVAIVGMPTVREDDGLALSSRNARLAPAERQAATCLHRALLAAGAAHASGERGAREIERVALRVVDAEPLAGPQYVEVRDARDLAAVERCEGPVVLAMAVHVGSTRLIDNVVLGR